MKRIILLGILVCFLWASGAWATTYTGSTNLNATSAWSDATFTWEVEEDTSTNLWTYTYTFEDFGELNPQKDLSHLIFQVSNNFVEGNIDDQSRPWELKEYSQDGEGASNPGLPDSIYGVKMESDDENPVTFWIESNRTPMWGDVYMKDGVSNGTSVYAFNTGFGTDPGSLPIESADNDWALVPDTETAPVPEPGTMLLLGAGLVGLAGFAGRKYRTSRS